MTAARSASATLILALAISAGIHGALTPDHFREATAAGGGFLAATIALATVALAFTCRPTAAVAAAAALVFAALIGSYALAATTGVPLLHPDVEPVDWLAVVTKAIEAIGLLVALSFARRSGSTHQFHVLRQKGTLT